jgi:hypothetical protein
MRQTCSAINSAAAPNLATNPAAAAAEASSITANSKRMVGAESGHSCDALQLPAAPAPIKITSCINHHNYQCTGGCMPTSTIQETTDEMAKWAAATAAVTAKPIIWPMQVKLVSACSEFAMDAQQHQM